MLYYADERVDLPVRDVLASAAGRLEVARASPAHDALVAILVESSALAQGVADAQFDVVGRDDDPPATRSAMQVAREAAAAVWESWSGGAPRLASVGEALERCAGAEALPPVLPVRVPEGYAHYAVFPELFGEAARGLASGARFVIGIRSIGVGLAAMVATASGAKEVVSVRPVGPPFERRLTVGGALAARLRAAIAGGARFAIVDEGPGLSGSSFAAVARWLEGAGCQPDRIVLFPAHLGPPGRAASAATRAWWGRVEKRVVGFDAALRPRLEAWAARELGARQLVDLSAGAWRAHVSGADELPVFRQQERLKFLARGDDRAHLLRFAGFGSYLERARARAAALAEAGYAAPVAGAAYGFLAQRWIDGRPAPPASVSREGWLAHLARYLAFRSRRLPAGTGEGASPGALLEMLRLNATEALGPEAGAAVDALAPGVASALTLPRCAVDGKLEWWEWLLDAQGALVKSDATDHASGHDLAGPQPIGWDVAAAAIELELGEGSAQELAARVAEAGGGNTPPAALALFGSAYLAHRLGRWSFALGSESDAAERQRIAALLDRYSRLLSAALGRARCA